MKDTSTSLPSPIPTANTAGSIYADPAGRRAVLMAIRGASDGKWITGRKCLVVLQPVIGVRRNASELLRLFRRRGMLTAKRGDHSAKKATQIRLTARAERFLSGKNGKGAGRTFKHRRQMGGNDLGGKINAYLALFNRAVARRNELGIELGSLDRFIKDNKIKVANLKAALKGLE